MNILLMSVVLILGDSHAQGFPGKILADRLTDKGYEVARYTRIGAGVPWVINDKFDLDGKFKFIFIGTNDKVHKNIHKHYQKLKKIYPDIYVIGPPAYPNNPKLDRTSYEISKVQKKVFKKKFLDSRKCTIQVRERYPDGIHFNYYGAKEWMNCIMSQKLR